MWILIQTEVCTISSSIQICTQLHSQWIAWITLRTMFPMLRTKQQATQGLQWAWGGATLASIQTLITPIHLCTWMVDTADSLLLTDRCVLNISGIIHRCTTLTTWWLVDGGKCKYCVSSSLLQCQFALACSGTNLNSLCFPTGPCNTENLSLNHFPDSNTPLLDVCMRVKTIQQEDLGRNQKKVKALIC